MNILFWNTSRNDKQININDSIKNMVLEKSCDIVLLAEYSFEINELISMINVADSRNNFVPIIDYNGCNKIKGLVNNKYEIEVLQGQTRYLIIKLKTTFFELIIGTIHNLDRKNSGESERSEILRIFNNDILYNESKHNTKNTILLGDFNDNPFDASMISAHTIHAIPYKEEVTKKRRKVNGTYYEKFYNPMWKLLARENPPYGTYYYNNGRLANCFWWLFDQVIIRPDVIPAFNETNLTILTQTTNHNLMQKRKPNINDYSDHLPIFFTIDEECLP